MMIMMMWRTTVRATNIISTACLLRTEVQPLKPVIFRMKLLGPLRSLTSTALRMSSSSSTSNDQRLLDVSSSSSCPNPIPDNPPFVRGIVFDMDGTLTVPNLNFAEMYRRCNVEAGLDILHEIEHKMSEERAAECHAIIEEMEERGRQTLQLVPGCPQVLSWCRHHNIPTALVTRNTQKTVERLLELLRQDNAAHVQLMTTTSGTTQSSSSSIFDMILSRDNNNNHPPKPDPASLRYILEHWSIIDDDKDDSKAATVVMVGDSPTHDVGYGQAVGTTTALVDTGRRIQQQKQKQQKSGMDSNSSDLPQADCTVLHLWELPRWLWLNRQIDGSLGTHSPLLKFDTPVPSTQACDAAANGDLVTLQALSSVDSDADCLWNVCPGTGNTPLIWACNAGHVDVVEYLLQRLPSSEASRSTLLDVRGYIGATAVSRAACRGHEEILELLAKAGANLDVPNDKMQYPLHFAAFKQHLSCVHTLLEHGANPFVLDRKGRTPSLDTSNAEIRNILEQAMMQKVESLMATKP